MSNGHLKERRKYIRLEYSRKVDYSFKANPKHKGQGATEDISLNGMKLTLTENLKPGTKLDLVFTPIGYDTIYISGKVVWTKQITNKKPIIYNSGIEFGVIKKKCKAAFTDFMVELGKKILELEG